VSEYRPGPPGLALERTTMAWVRTSLVFSAVALLFLRFPGAGAVVVVPTLVGLALAGGLGLSMWLRQPARMTRFHAGSARPERDAAGLVTAFTVLLALAALVLVLVGG
jgi:uncharacterized membrane protein YidH (DUF202 family)